MGFIKVNTSHAPPSLVFASELWIFAILTVILLAITLSIWLLWDSRNRPRWKKNGNQAEAVGSEKA
jgi:hypothetical protein